MPQPDERDLPLTQYRIDAFATRLYQGVELGDRVVSTTMLSTSDAVARETVASRRSAQSVVQFEGTLPDTVLGVMVDFSLGKRFLVCFVHLAGCLNVECEGGIRYPLCVQIQLSVLVTEAV